MSFKVSVRVIPKAKKEAIEYFDEQKLLKVWTTVAPVDGKANEKVIELVAKYLKIPKREVEIVTGLTSENKIIEIAAEIPESELIMKRRLF